MKSYKHLIIATKTYMSLSLISLFYVSLMALLDPQAVMDLVQVKLENNDALSSIRGVYGGVGFTICLSTLYLLVNFPEKGAAFLSLFWGSYAFSRLITLLSDGPLGDFGTQWFFIEGLFALLGLGLWFALKSKRRQQKFIPKQGF
ncbi:DUF4345 domain-containing protein [Algoriphagus sp. CAU 1675]|uniref:DUF4345 domain-containing protein n=1 Tax=Algoriphagus sp. CAU 1675 TaxID=3032597 RepID=UPI0023DC257B|nr:DUF4345 domain-containing protein [Algoriphagus sp. CAU 1675]MDF2157044.1 DUF4345 domain-containing protein [Algoriphagus sp. CAU 1675]